MSTNFIPWTKDRLPSPSFETTGRIVFDPDRGDMKRRISNWVVINLDQDVAALYRWFFRKHWYDIDRGGRRRPIYQPAWGAHVSVVRGEASRLLSVQEQRDAWFFAKDRFNGLKVTVSYTNHIRQTGDTTGGDRPDHFWFVEAYSECVMGIRNMLRLPVADSRTGRGFSSHITIGRTYE